MSRSLAVLLFDDVEVLDFCGPFEVFSVASRQTDPPAFDVFIVAEKPGAVVARNGLLDEREATTHHVGFDLLREVAPAATVHENRRFVDDGKIITSAGIAAGIDMSLYVVERLLGAEVAAATARHMEYPWRT